MRTSLEDRLGAILSTLDEKLEKVNTSIETLTRNTENFRYDVHAVGQEVASFGGAVEKRFKHDLEVDEQLRAEDLAFRSHVYQGLERVVPGSSKGQPVPIVVKTPPAVQIRPIPRYSY